MASFVATASFSSAIDNFLVGSALSLTRGKVQHFSKDTSWGNVYVGASATQKIYESSDEGASVAPITYVYAQASAANSEAVSIIYTSGSDNIQIGKLGPGEWMYIPFAAGAHQSSSLSVKAGSGGAANVAILFAESGSLA